MIHRLLGLLYASKEIISIPALIGIFQSHFSKHWIATKAPASWIFSTTLDSNVVTKSINTMILLVIPVSIGAIVLSKPIVQVLFD